MTTFLYYQMTTKQIDILKRIHYFQRYSYLTEGITHYETLLLKERDDTIREILTELRKYNGHKYEETLKNNYFDKCIINLPTPDFNYYIDCLKDEITDNRRYRNDT